MKGNNSARSGERALVTASTALGARMGAEGTQTKARDKLRRLQENRWSPAETQVPRVVLPGSPVRGPASSGPWWRTER
jgi:hypothetical protein